MTLPGEERRKAEMKTPNIGTELRPNGDVISFMHRQADLIEAEGHDVTASALREGIKALKSAPSPSELAGYYRDALRWRWLCSDDSDGSKAWNVLTTFGVTKEECDVAVDAAISAQGEKK